MRAIIGQSAPLVRVRLFYPVLQRLARVTGLMTNRNPRPMGVVSTPVEARKSHGGSPCQGMPRPCS
jgi:hypothetical protein